MPYCKRCGDWVGNFREDEWPECPNCDREDEAENEGGETEEDENAN